MLENLLAMEQRRPPEYIIEVFADPSSVKDVVRGINFPFCVVFWDTGRRGELMLKEMDLYSLIAVYVVLVGGILWGLFGLFNINILTAIFGSPNNA